MSSSRRRQICVPANRVPRSPFATARCGPREDGHRVRRRRARPQKTGRDRGRMDLRPRHRQRIRRAAASARRGHADEEARAQHLLEEIEGYPGPPPPQLSSHCDLGAPRGRRGRKISVATVDRRSQWDATRRRALVSGRPSAASTARGLAEASVKRAVFVGVGVGGGDQPALARSPGDSEWACRDSKYVRTSAGRS